MAHFDEWDDYLSYERFTRKDNDTDLAKKLAWAFSKVFATKPWNEWRYCTVCGAHWGIDERRQVEQLRYQHCGESVVEFWPEWKVLDDLKKEITQDTSCWLAMDSGNVIGFTWGYPITIEELEAKLGISLQEAFKQQDVREPIAYQDELGLIEGYRGKKIARRLFELRLKDLLKQGLTYGIVRTRELPEPSVTYEWFTKKLGYRVLARYPEGDGRVVLGQELAEVRRLLAP